VLISVIIVRLIIQPPTVFKLNWEEAPTKMGAEILKFSGFFDNRELLKDFDCLQCKQPISEQDVSEKNYNLWVSDYANDISKSESFAGRVERNLTAYSLTFWLKGVEHEYCPETETCENCCERFLMENMKEFAGDYYCLSCCQANKEVNHE